MNRVTHFEIGAENPERVTKFYTEVFGWKIEKWEGGEFDYWLVSTGEKDELGINGGIFKRAGDAFRSESMPSANNFVCTVSVEDIDTAIKLIKENGGEIVQEKSNLAMVGWLAYARDTEGNIFGVMQATEKMM